MYSLEPLHYLFNFYSFVILAHSTLFFISIFLSTRSGPISITLCYWLLTPREEEAKNRVWSESKIPSHLFWIALNEWKLTKSKMSVQTTENRSANHLLALFTRNMSIIIDIFLAQPQINEVQLSVRLLHHQICRF